jgi:hypothetical protein
LGSVVLLPIAGADMLLTLLLLLLQRLNKTSCCHLRNLTSGKIWCDTPSAIGSSELDISGTPVKIVMHYCAGHTSVITSSREHGRHRS